MFLKKSGKGGIPGARIICGIELWVLYFGNTLREETCFPYKVLIVYTGS